MNKSPSLAPSQESGSGVRHAVAETLAAAARVVPNVSRLRRNAKAWALFRVFLGIAGASLVVLPVGLANNYYYAVAGLVMFIASILLPPPKPPLSVEEKARDLGALGVVDGGQFVSAASSRTPVHLFVCAQRVLAVDAHLQTLLDVPVSELHLAHAEETNGGWLLSIAWADRVAQFVYRGMSAEHRAHMAETAVRTVMLPALPEVSKSRAANA
jgi:hypothetical protein